MKKTTLFLAGLLFAMIGIAQSGISDTLFISGRISKIETLQKDWNASNGNSGEKIYHIYWLKFTIPTDTIDVQPSGSVGKLPPVLVFSSPSSGLFSELEAYRHFNEKDKVVIKVRKDDLNQFIMYKTGDIMILSIRKRQSK
jgi:hypothetical protein